MMLTSTSRRVPFWGHLLIAVGIMAVAAFIEYEMGRLPMCKCGYIRFWVGDVNSSENSQQIADWYSFSHIIHGFALYGIMRLIGRRKWPIGLCLVLAVFVEASWEVLENSSFIINRYRNSTMSLDYFGDSILNSMSDILFCVLGFFLAARLPVWVTVALVVVMEIGVGYAIRDNLTLNIIMLIHPSEAIRHWQMGRG
ncbi:MAG: hypothetical protein JWL69_1714 [Phycisphaerales bacterium]|nr:hypothetical protein [Phycisphaerales bacterium]